MEPKDDPPPYSPPTPIPTAPIIVQPPKIFGPNPMQLTCGNCHQQIRTSVAHEYGSCTIIAAVTIFLFCCPFFWVPFLMDSCKDVHHLCPSCNAHLGTSKII